MVDLSSQDLVGLVAVVTLPAAVLSAMFVSEQAGAVVAVVGWFLLVPVLGILVDDDADESEGESDASDPLETLRDRYARGEIDEAEFERRVERLLETEDDSVAGDVSGFDSDGYDVERER